MATFSIGPGGIIGEIFASLFKSRREDKIRAKWRRLDGKVSGIRDASGRSVEHTANRPSPFVYDISAFDPVTNSMRTFTSKKRRRVLAMAAPVAVYVNPNLRWSSFVDLPEKTLMDDVNAISDVATKITDKNTWAQIKAAQPTMPSGPPADASPASPELVNYIQAEFARGMQPDVIRATLIAGGWDAYDVDRAMNAPLK